jgi:hypothetical protein
MKNHLWLILLLGLGLSPVYGDSVSGSIDSYNQALALIAQSRFDDAISILNGLKEQQINYKYLYVTLGDAYAGKGDYASAQENMLFYLNDIGNKTEDPERYGIALGHYLEVLSKLKDCAGVDLYFKKSLDSPVTVYDDQIDRVQTYLDIAGFKGCRPADKLRYIKEGIKILGSLEASASQKTWFNNDFGHALILKQTFYNAESATKAGDLALAHQYFLNEKKINPSAVVDCNISVSTRLLGENYKELFLTHVDQAGADGKTLAGYAKNAVSYFEKALSELEMAKQEKDFPKYQDRYTKLASFGQSLLDSFKNREVVKKYLEEK